jgi:uncharacterized protein (TIGR03083 family)
VSETTGTDFWSKVKGYRHQLADHLETLLADDWDKASRCEGWRVRDVVGHLIHLSEASQTSMARDLFRNGVLPDKALSAMATKTGQDSPTALVQRLRAASGGRFHVPGSPRAVVLGEVIVHSADALEPLGASLPVVPADANQVLDTYRRVGRLVFHAPSTSKVRLVATDSEWSAGTGPEVRGTTVDLVQLLANRKQVVPRLEGPGVSSL